MKTVARSFVELLAPRPGLTVGENQAAARKALPEFLNGSDMRLWRPEQPISTSSQRLLIGIAPYSVHDLKLLDLVQATLCDRETFGQDLPAVDIFDVLDCRTQSDFEKYFPGIRSVTQTPVVGLWNNGVLTETGQGYDARMLVYRTLKLQPEECDQQLFQRRVG